MVKKCILCKMTVDDRVKCGEFITKPKAKISVHYYCLLLTSNLVQNGADHEGILGFLPVDIRREELRVRKQICWYCSNPSANLACCASKCQRKFHLYCGIMNGAICHFTEDFKTICEKHHHADRKKCTINDNCVICCETMGGYNRVHSILAPCCKSGWFHKWCIAEFAINAGYFFKCPLCNNKETFRSKLVHKGIFVPDQDATWELEPNAFADLLERPDSCSACKCKCPKGRNYDKYPYSFLMCNTCGSKCIHSSCMTNRSKAYTCDECLDLLSVRKSNELEIQKVHKLNDVIISIKTDDYDEEIDVAATDGIVEIFNSDSESEDSLIAAFTARDKTSRNIQNGSVVSAVVSHEISPASSSTSSECNKNNNNSIDGDERQKVYYKPPNDDNESVDSMVLKITKQDGIGRNGRIESNSSIESSKENSPPSSSTTLKHNHSAGDVEKEQDITAIFQKMRQRKRKGSFLSISDTSSPKFMNCCKSSDSNIVNETSTTKLINCDSDSLNILSDSSLSSSSDIGKPSKIHKNGSSNFEILTGSDSNEEIPLSFLFCQSSLIRRSFDDRSLSKQEPTRLRSRAKSCYLERLCQNDRPNNDIRTDVRRSLRLIRSKSIGKSNDSLCDDKKIRHAGEKMKTLKPNLKNSINLILQRDMFPYLSHSDNPFQEALENNEELMQETVQLSDSLIPRLRFCRN